MQDRTLQRSYVKQAASRKNALNLREYPTPNRVNNINNNNNNNNHNATKTTRKAKTIAIPTIDQHVPHLIVFPPGYDLHDHSLVENGNIILQDKASCLPAYILSRALGYAKSATLYENMNDNDFKKNSLAFISLPKNPFTPCL